VNDAAATNDLQALYQDQFKVVKNPDGTPGLVHKVTGVEAREFVNTVVRTLSPTLFPKPPHVDMELAAFGDREAGVEGNKTARGQLLKSIGEVEYKAREKAWDAQNFKQGKRPANLPAGEKAADKTTSSTNPWSKEGWDFAKQAHLVRTLGYAKAQQIAQSAGGWVGQTAYGAPALAQRSFR